MDQGTDQQYGVIVQNGEIEISKIPLYYRALRMMPRHFGKAWRSFEAGRLIAMFLQP